MVDKTGVLLPFITIVMKSYGLWQLMEVEDNPSLP